MIINPIAKGKRRGPFQHSFPQSPISKDSRYQKAVCPSSARGLCLSTMLQFYRHPLSSLLFILFLAKVKSRPLFEAPVEQCRPGFVETGEQEEAPFRVGGKPVAFLSLGCLRSKADTHRTVIVFLQFLLRGIDAAVFYVANVGSRLQVVSRDNKTLPLPQVSAQLGSKIKPMRHMTLF